MRLFRHAFPAIALALLGAEVQAEGLSGGALPKSRAALFAAQTRLIDTRLATQYSDSVRLKPKPAKGSAKVPGYNGQYRGEYMEMARQAARTHGVPEDLFLRLVQQESGWNPNAVSVKGATGLAQLMPETAGGLGVDATDPGQNLDGGARYLRAMFDKFGDWRLARAAYNAGPEAVTKYGGIPPYDETTNYVTAIMGS